MSDSTGTSATNNRALISRGAYPKGKRGNCRLAAHLHCKQQRQKLFQRACLHLPPPARKVCVQDESLQGQASSGRNTAPGTEVVPLHQPKSVAADQRWGRSADRHSVSQRICCFKHCFSLFARGPATLSDLPKRPQRSLPMQQFSAFLPFEDPNFC